MKLMEAARQGKDLRRRTTDPRRAGFSIEEIGSHVRGKRDGCPGRGLRPALRGLAAVGESSSGDHAGSSGLERGGTDDDQRVSHDHDPGPQGRNEEGWSFSASVNTYPCRRKARLRSAHHHSDRDWLHLEARYNYEALETDPCGWAKFAGGDRLAWSFTPMLGGVFGDINGIVPGYRGLLSWWKLQLHSEGEFAQHGRFPDSLYNWSELILADWLHLEHTRAYETDPNKCFVREKEVI